MLKTPSSATFMTTMLSSLAFFLWAGASALSVCPTARSQSKAALQDTLVSRMSKGSR